MWLDLGTRPYNAVTKEKLSVNFRGKLEQPVVLSSLRTKFLWIPKKALEKYIPADSCIHLTQLSKVPLESIRISKNKRKEKL